jgi:serine/threonine-protein kinase
MTEAYSRAVELDPDFAIAWANLSMVQTLSYADFDPTAARLAEAKRALDNALKLQPDSGDAYFALGLYRYRALHDFDSALQAFGEAIERGVNRALALEFSGYVKRRQGKWDEALAHHAESVQIDPRNPIIFSERAVTYRSLRRFAEAHTALDRALEISPDNQNILAQKASVYQAAGDFDAAGRLIERLGLDARDPGIISPRYAQLMCAGKFAETKTMLEHLLATGDPLPTILRAVYRGRLGAVKRLAGDAEGAQRDLTQARDAFEALRQQSVDGEGFLENLIEVEGMLGDAASVDQHAAKLQDNIANDAFNGPALELSIATARAQLGQTDKAIALLRDLLRKPGADCITTAMLRADPIWNPLRSDPRFQKLCEAQ